MLVLGRDQVSQGTLKSNKRIIIASLKMEYKGAWCSSSNIMAYCNDIAINPLFSVLPSLSDKIAVSSFFFLFSFGIMCQSLWVTHSTCGHRTRRTTYCRNVTIDIVTSRRHMCRNRQSTRSAMTGSLCRKAGCQLSRVYAYWRCCRCGKGPNRHWICNCAIRQDGRNYACPHEVCQTCEYFVGMCRARNQISPVCS